MLNTTRSPRREFLPTLIPNRPRTLLLLLILKGRSPALLPLGPPLSQAGGPRQACSNNDRDSRARPTPCPLSLLPLSRAHPPSARTRRCFSHRLRALPRCVLHLYSPAPAGPGGAALQLRKAAYTAPVRYPWRCLCPNKPEPRAAFWSLPTQLTIHPRSKQEPDCAGKNHTSHPLRAGPQTHRPRISHRASKHVSRGEHSGPAQSTT